MKVSRVGGEPAAPRLVAVLLATLVLPWTANLAVVVVAVDDAVSVDFSIFQEEATMETVASRAIKAEDVLVVVVDDGVACSPRTQKSRASRRPYDTGYGSQTCAAWYNDSCSAVAYNVALMFVNGRIVGL